MKRIAVMMLIALVGVTCVAVAQDLAPEPPAGAPPGPPPGPAPLGDPELARLTTDIVVLRAINRINATPEQLGELADLLRDLGVAEGELREQAREVLAKERARLLRAKPGEQPPPGDGLQAIKVLTMEFQTKVQAAELEAQKLLEPEQMRAFRLLLAMTRGERLAQRSPDRMPRAKRDFRPELDGPPPPGAPPPGDRDLRERMRERMGRAGALPRPPVPLQRVLELIEEKLAALGT